MRVRASSRSRRAALAVAARAGRRPGGGKKVLRLGWAQEPQTLNPFIDQDEEDFRVWSINYNLLVDFSPKDLGPVAGIAESWEISPDKKTVTFKLVRGAQVVRRPADHLQGRQVQPRDVRPQQPAVRELRRERHLDRDAGRPDGGDQEPSNPTRGSSAACSPTSCPSTSGARCRSSSSPAPTSRRSRWSAAAPTSSREFQRGRIIRMTRNPYFRGAKPKFDEIQWIKYGTNDAVERALHARRDRPHPRGPRRRPSRASAKTKTSRRSTRLAVVHPARLQPLQQAELPGREVQPGRPGPSRCARRSPTRST